MKADASPPVVLWKRDSNELMHASPSFRARFGLDRTALGQGSLLEWTHPEDREALEKILAAGMGRATARHRTATGEWLELDWQVRSEVGETYALGVGPGEDGTALGPTRASAERDSQGTRPEALTAMAHLVERKNPGLRCSILLVDPDQGNISVGAGPSFPAEYNAAVEKLCTGPTVGSCGTATFWGVPVVVEDIAEDPLWSAIKDKAIAAGLAACWSHPITATNGRILGAMALYDTKPGRPTRSQMDGLEVAAGMVGLAIERDRLEEQMAQMAKMEALGVLAGGIAHDFNNLLATILGNAELALASTAGCGPAHPMLEDVVAASLSARDLCNQMLAYAGRSSMSIEGLDCNDLVRELGGLLQVALSKKATLVYELHEGPLGLQADRSQLGQVVMNLITNASEALGGDEGRIQLSTGLRAFSGGEAGTHQDTPPLAAGEYVFLRVSDNGEGMSAETRRKVFDPFFSTKAVGRGLGLAAIKGIVSRHGGAIRLESTLGRGTTFTVYLPHEPDASAGPPRELPLPESRSEDHVLVVDDEPAVLRMLCRTLEKAGYTVTCAADGQEAVEIYRRLCDSIDCVLLDLNMPRLDGEETFQELRKIRGDVRVILSSGNSEEALLKQFEAAPLAGVLHKPARRPRLLAAVAAAIHSPAAAPGAV